MWIVVVACVAVAACDSGKATSPSPSKSPAAPLDGSGNVGDCGANALAIQLRQANYPSDIKAHALVDLYCETSEPIAKHVMLCTSNFNGSEQKWISVTVAVNKAAAIRCSDLRMVPAAE